MPCHLTSTGPAWKLLLFSQNLSSWVRGIPTSSKCFFCFALVTKATEPCDFALVSLDISMFACETAFNILPSNLAAVALWDWSAWTQGPDLLLVWIIDRDQSGGMLQYVHASVDCLGQVVRLSSGAEASFWPFSHVSFVTWNLIFKLNL